MEVKRAVMTRGSNGAVDPAYSFSFNFHQLSFFSSFKNLGWYSFHLHQNTCAAMVAEA
jgi:hypothetical protein